MHSFCEMYCTSFLPFHLAMQSWSCQWQKSSENYLKNKFSFGFSVLTKVNLCYYSQLRRRHVSLSHSRWVCTLCHSSSLNSASSACRSRGRQTFVRVSGGGGDAKLYVEWIDGSEASFVVVAAFWSDLCIAREECDM